MVGEFEGPSGGEGDYVKGDFVMLVNISLEKAANVKLSTIQNYKWKGVVSTVDGHMSLLDEKDGQWLPPGGGILIKLTN
jgi:hypothetical protein